MLWWFLPYINMNQPWVHMGPHQSWIPLPPLSPLHPSGLSQSTSFECPASCIELALVICFIYDNIHVSMLFYHIIPPLPSLYFPSLEEWSYLGNVLGSPETGLFLVTRLCVLRMPYMWASWVLLLFKLTTVPGPVPGLPFVESVGCSWEELVAKLIP